MNIKTNPENLDAYLKYVLVKDKIHEFLKSQLFIELDLPVLSPALVPESYLEVFKSQYKSMNNREDLFLTPSPELFIKRFLVYVKKDCYFLGKSFRNGESNSSRHSSEFTMLELYRIGADYMDIADLVLHMLKHLADNKEITYRNIHFKFDDWEKLTVDDSFVKYAGLKKKLLFDKHAFMQKALEKGYVVNGFTYEDVFSQMYVQEVEPQLGMNGKATLLYDYPKEFAALAKLNHDGQTAQRFEFYIAGIELGDCYSELTNPNEQKERFEEENKKRSELDLIRHPVDWGFVDALRHGLDPCSGIAIGFDRLAMVFCGVESIHDLRVIDIV